MALFEPILEALHGADVRYVVVGGVAVVLQGHARLTVATDERGGSRDAWEAHRQEQLEAVAAATPAQRLAWLEEAIRFAHRVGALPRDEDERRS